MGSYATEHGEEAVRSRTKKNMITGLMPRIGLYNRFVREMTVTG